METQKRRANGEKKHNSMNITSYSSVSPYLCGENSFTHESQTLSVTNSELNKF